MQNPKISIVAAIGKNRELGKDNRLLWNIPEDMQRFKKTTSAHAIIMGQKTFESIGRSLPNRKNIVLSRDPDFLPADCVVASSISQAIDEAKKVEDDEIFFIGGGSVYEQALCLADKLYLTLIDDALEADTFFPDYSAFTKKRKVGGGNSDGIKFEFWEMQK